MENKKLEEFENYIRGKNVAIIGMGVSNIPLLDYLYNLDADYLKNCKNDILKKLLLLKEAMTDIAVKSKKC